MEFRQIEAFNAVAEYKSFSKAAEALFLTQSTVSTHIKNLEREFGKQLIVRTTKSIRLTEEGQRLLTYAKRMIETRAAAVEDISRPREHLLHIGASTVPSAFILPELMCAYRLRSPQTSFDVRQGDSRDICEMLLDGSVEVGFVGAAGDDPRCVNIPFYRDETVLAVPKTDKYRAYRLPEDIDALVKNEQFIMRESGSGTQRAAEACLAGMGIESSALRVTVRTNDTAAIKEMLARGMGVTLCSRLAVRDMERSGSVIAVPLPGAARRVFYISYLKERKQSPELKKFTDFAAAFYGHGGEKT